MVIFKSFFGGPAPTEIMTNALDLVITVAGLVSNQTAIAPLLERVHAIAAQLPPGALLANEDEATLFDIYLQLEKYLMTSDPIRTFNKQELRAKASRGLLARLETYEKQTGMTVSDDKNKKQSYRLTEA